MAKQAVATKARNADPQHGSDGSRAAAWRRAIAVVAVGVVVISLSYVGRVVGGSEPDQRSEVRALPAATVDRSELDRLIEVFADRAPSRNDSLEYRTLGRLLLERAGLTAAIEDYAGSARAYETALQLAPGETDATVGLARASLGLHDFATARRLAIEVVEQAPARLDAVAAIGDAALALGRYEEAESHYTALREVAPADPAVFIRSAQLAAELGDFDAARRFADGAIAAAPAESSVFYLTAAAAIAVESGDLDHAGRLLDRAHERAPQDPGTLEQLGALAATSGELGEAIGWYEAAVAIRPTLHALEALGDLYTVTGRQSDADRTYDEVARLATMSPAHEQVYRLDYAHFVLDRNGDVAAALETIERELAIRDDALVHDLHAWALYRNGRIDEARRASDTALDAGRPGAEALYHSGLISLALGDPARGHADLRQALDMDPRFHPLLAPHARSVLRNAER